MVVSVKDDGRGTDAAMLARASEPFFTTEEAGKGSDSPRSSVSRFRRVESCGSNSRPGVGTNAEIWLPTA